MRHALFYIKGENQPEIIIVFYGTHNKVDAYESPKFL
ncbi:unnamed protein product [Cuscuta epithymum]|uniref:Uncharacterized protein n=1 Tax=Cuscuta epithymum TaxID=186058 RepID=A0AAV0DP06_9ASTE|nr:unnamed protein product [Cuscuta epithymum]